MEKKLDASAHRSEFSDIEPTKHTDSDSEDPIMVELVFRLMKAESANEKVTRFKSMIVLRARDLIAAELERLTEGNLNVVLHRISNSLKFHRSYDGTNIPLWDYVLQQLALSTINNIFAAADVQTKQKVAEILKSTL